jgi:glyoxylase-like metal-dependent hydrolase (beta-lactamase superfamily II)
MLAQRMQSELQMSDELAVQRVLAYLASALLLTACSVSHAETREPPPPAVHAAKASGASVASEQNEAYLNMPEIPAIGVRTGRYADIPESARGPAIDPAKGYRTQAVGSNLYMVTEGAYQAMFLVYESGVVLVDAPPSLAAFLPKAIAEVTNKPITHLIYSHSHADHIGAASSIAGHATIIAQAETKRLLKRANDIHRPLPTVTFADSYELRVGSELLQLSYFGNGHEPGNIFIYAPRQKTLMLVDVVFPGWMPWRRLVESEDIPGFYAAVEKLKAFDFDTLVSGHLTRTGTRADVDLQSAFMSDLRAAGEHALKTTEPGRGLAAEDKSNPYAVFDNYLDRAAIGCVNELTPKWASKLAGFDVFIWDQCYAIENSIHME